MRHSLRMFALASVLACAVSAPVRSAEAEASVTHVADATPAAAAPTFADRGTIAVASIDTLQLIHVATDSAIDCARDTAQLQVAHWRAAPPAARTLRAVVRRDSSVGRATRAPTSRRNSVPPLGHLLLMGMTALAADRDTPRKDGKLFSFPIKAAKKIYRGAIVVLTGGYAEPGATALNLTAVGRANDTVDNSAGADGDLNVPVERGVFRFANSAAGDAIALSDVGSTCYIVDDQTVAKTDGTGTRSAAGTIRDVDAAGVWVEI